jgi:hypothetical protein
MHSSTSRPVGLFLFLSLGLLPLSACTNGTDIGASPLREKGKEDWYRVLIEGRPAGFARLTERAQADGTIITSAFQRLQVRRNEDPMTIEVESEVEETSEGSVVRFRIVQRTAENDQVTEGVVRGDKLEITARGLGASRASTVPYDPAAIGPRRMEKLLLEKLRSPGDSFSAKVFSPETIRCGVQQVTRGDEEEVPFPGGARRLVRRTGRIDFLPGNDIVEWIDAAGKVWKTRMSMGTQSIETYLSTADEILREKIASPPEIFLSTSVKPDPPPQNIAAREIVYRISLKKGDFRTLGIDGMFRGTGQEVLREESPSVRVVRIRKVLPEKSVARPVPPPPGLEDCAAPSVFIQSDDPLIEKLSREAAGNETDAFAAARSLEKWVRGNVKFKDLKTAFASALEVAEKLEGDCTEHGVLLAALARAAGIPARAVSGLVWYGDSFVGHLWTEVYIDRWIPLDGTRGRGEVGPDHIAIAASALSGGSAADLFLDMVQVIGNLKIEVLEEK